MLQTFIIIYREVLEIALVVGILIAATRGLSARARWIRRGLALGTAGAVAVAFFAEVISSAAQGMGQELFNATVLFLAAGLIAWTVIWMNRYGRQINQQFKDIGRSVAEGRQPVKTLALVVALAVLREGSEAVLFLYGVITTGTSPLSLLAGGMLGLAAGAATGTALYYGLLKISPRHLFGVTSWLLIFLAAGMVSQALGYLSAGGFVPELTSVVYDTSRVLPEHGFIGKILHMLFGYSDRPSGIQFIGYISTIGGIFFTMKIGQPKISLGAKSVVAVLLFVSVLAGPASTALAFNKIYSPIVERGELEFEMQGAVDFDRRSDVDGTQQQKYALGYGVTDRWFTEVYGEIEKQAEGEGDPDAGTEAEEHKFEYTATEWENRFQLFEQGEHWLDAGLYFAYEWSNEQNHADLIEAKLLLEKQFGRFVHDLNLTLEKEVGGGPKEQLAGGLGWGTRYRLEPYLEPGFEYHAEFGEFKAKKDFDQQSHLIGPTLCGRLGTNMKYNIGYLFGISDAAPQRQLKWIVEFESRF